MRRIQELGEAALNDFILAGHSFIERRGTEKDFEAGIRVAEGAMKYVDPVYTRMAATGASRAAASL